MVLTLFPALLLLSSAHAFNTTLFKSLILNYHNRIRWVHNAPPLIEDQELENGAANWAYHLATYPSAYCLHHNQAGGQNIYFAWQTKPMSEYDLARNTMKAFYDEQKYYDYSRPYFTQPASHFTNLIWKSVQRIGISVYWKSFYNQHGGCHMQAYPTMPLLGYMVVIHEWPRGNIMTTQDFTRNVLPPKEVYNVV